MREWDRGREGERCHGVNFRVLEYFVPRKSLTWAGRWIYRGQFIGSHLIINPNTHLWVNLNESCFDSLWLARSPAWFPNLLRGGGNAGCWVAQWYSLWTQNNNRIYKTNLNSHYLTSANANEVRLNNLFF